MPKSTNRFFKKNVTKTHKNEKENGKPPKNEKAGKKGVVDLGTFDH